MMKKVTDRIGIILKEIINVLTNILIPLLGLVMLIIELLPVPNSILSLLKQVEYWLFKISGTADNIDQAIKDKYYKK